MPGFFEAIANLPKEKPKKFFVSIDGVEHEVTHDKKLWALQHNEEDLMIKDGDIVLRPKPKPKTQYSVLKEAEKGYVFQDDDIHWPTEIVEGGRLWLTEQE